MYWYVTSTSTLIWLKSILHTYIYNRSVTISNMIANFKHNLYSGLWFERYMWNIYFDGGGGSATTAILRFAWKSKTLLFPPGIFEKFKGTWNEFYDIQAGEFVVISWIFFQRFEMLKLYLICFMFWKEMSKLKGLAFLYILL